MIQGDPYLGSKCWRPRLWYEKEGASPQGTHEAAAVLQTHLPLCAPVLCCGGFGVAYLVLPEAAVECVLHLGSQQRVGGGVI